MTSGARVGVSGDVASRLPWAAAFWGPIAATARREAVTITKPRTIALPEEDIRRPPPANSLVLGERTSSRVDLGGLHLDGRQLFKWDKKVG